MTAVRSRWPGVANAIFSTALCAALVAPCFPTDAQPQKKIPHIVYLTLSPTVSVNGARYEAFRQGLRDLGYVEGKNVVVEWRHADGKLDRLSMLSAELVRLNVDVIVTSGSVNTRAVKEATATVPIVMAQDPDPVGNGFVASLARPGGNITGLSNLAPELSGKRLQLLKEIIPKLSRLAVLGTSAYLGNAQSLTETELASRTYAVKLQYLDILNAEDLEPAFRTAAKTRADAVVALGGPVLNPARARIVELAAKSRLPAMYTLREYVEDGGLMSYGVSVTDLDRRAAMYVDKILKGIKPADLPVEQPKKFEFMINLKTAKQIGLIIPPNVLARADRVIR